MSPDEESSRVCTSPSRGREERHAMARALQNTTPNPLDMDYPSIEEGVAGMAFIEAMVASSANNAAWTPLDDTPAAQS
jgi:hypothetical protein